MKNHDDIWVILKLTDRLIDFDYREEANKVHHNVVDCFYKYVTKEGITTTVKKESELDQSDVTNTDLVISLGTASNSIITYCRRW